jgi:rifampicin phosphotransferase
MPECVAVVPVAMGARGEQPWVINLAEASNPTLCGGKVAGLAHLQRAGFSVPDGVCLTTELCRAALRETDVAARVEALSADPHIDPQARAERLAEIRELVKTAPLPQDMVAAIHGAVTSLRTHWNGMLAIRSSAVLEDHADTSHAGIHATFVGQFAAPAVVARVKACWASLWTERAWAYRERLGLPHVDAAMAVVVQRFVAGGRAGVAFSADPVSGDSATVVIEAARGTGAAVVAGVLTPEHYRVTVTSERVAVVRLQHVSPRPVLSEAEVRTLAQVVKRVEHALQQPADVEWVYDGDTLWLVQGRPLRRGSVRRDETFWTRANLKEVFPDLPSPLAASYLEVALNGMFREYHSAQGYAVQPAASLVRVFRGRPYLNLTLMTDMTVVRGGDPSIVSRLFGGAMPSAPPPPPSASRPITGLQQAARLTREVLTTVFLTPCRAQRLFRTIRRQAKRYAAVPLERLDDAAVREHLIRFGNTVLHPGRLGRLHEIVSAQSRAYMILGRLLAAWIPAEAERLLAQLLTGLGTLPNTRLMYRLVALSEEARADSRVLAFLTNARDHETLRTYRAALAGSCFLADFEGVLLAFGHRGPFESDVMSPRFGETPELLLEIVQMYLRAPALEDPARHEAYRRRLREAAERQVRLALRDGPWLTFVFQSTILSVVGGALQRLVAQRDENRHVTTLLVAHLRRIAQEMGHRAARAGHLATADDVFFVRWDELPGLLAAPGRNWRALIAERRRERAGNETVVAPDLLRGDESAEDGPRPSGPQDRHRLSGFGVSPGRVTGTVKIIKSSADLRALGGEIAVVCAIEPSLTSIFPVVSGLVAEIGGLLSHGAILAREYGLPAVVNAKDATRRLHDGDRIELDGTTGRIRLLRREPTAGFGAVPNEQRRDREADEGAGDHV